MWLRGKLFLKVVPLIPAFYFYLLIIYVLSNFNFGVSSENIIPAGAFLANLPFFDMGWFVVHSWSLATEEQFYLFFPFAFLLGWNLLGRKSFIIFWIILYLVWGGLAAVHKDGAAGPFYHLLWIMSGVIVSMYEEIFKNFAIKFNNFILSILVISLFIWSTGVISFPHQGILYIPFSCMVISLLLMRTIHSWGAYKKFLLNPLTQWIGLSSYSIYLWQQLFTYKISIIWTPLGIFCCAAFSFYFIEKPFNRIGRKFVTMRSSSKIISTEKETPLLEPT